MCRYRFVGASDLVIDVGSKPGTRPPPPPQDMQLNWHNSILGLSSDKKMYLSGMGSESAGGIVSRFFGLPESAAATARHAEANAPAAASLMLQKTSAS